MNTAAIRKLTGLDAIVRSYHPQIIEEPATTRVNPNALSALLGSYYPFLQEYVHSDEPWRGLFSEQGPADVLEPEQINRFLQLTSAMKHSYRYESLTSIFISRLIQNSIQDGYREFIIDVGASHFNYLGVMVKAPPLLHPRIIINGNVGWQCGRQAEGIEFLIKGRIPSKENSNSVGRCGRDAVGCTFKTDRTKTYNLFYQQVWREHNTIMLVDGEGRIITSKGSKLG